MLQKGEQVPQLDLTTLQGGTFSYSSVWQRRNLVLVALSRHGSESDADYVSSVIDRMPDFRSHEAECVITRDEVPGIPAPGVLVADRWGEIAHTASGRTVADLPTADELVEWVAYLQNRCPECEGEAR